MCDDSWENISSWIFEEAMEFVFSNLALFVTGAIVFTACAPTLPTTWLFLACVGTEVAEALGVGFLRCVGVLRVTVLF